MALRPRDKNPDVPATSKKAVCRRNVGDRKCGKDAVHVINSRVEIFDKIVPVKFPVCETHFKEIADVADQPT